MGKVKRVRFFDDKNDDFLKGGLNNSSNQEAAPAPGIIDAPKTSEYAFFKKFKKDAGCSYIRSQPEVDKAKSVECHSLQPGQPVGSTSFSDTLKGRHPGPKFSSLAEEERNAKHYPFISPLRDAATKSATKRQTGPIAKIKRSNSSMLLGNVIPVDHSLFFSPTTSASADEGNQYLGKGVFAEKRRKLHQRAVETLFSDLGEGCSKGLHITSRLLNRLLPKGCENDDTKLVEQKMDATDHLSTLPTSYRSPNKVKFVHRKSSMDLKNKSYFDDMTPTYFHGITKKNLASEREESLAVYDTEANFIEYVAYPQWITRHEKRNSSICFPSANMSTKAFHIQELDEYSDSSKAAKREPHKFLLDWDFKVEKEKTDFYLPAHDVEDYTYSTLRTFTIGPKEQFMGDNLDEIASPSLSFPRIGPEYDLMPYCQSKYFDTQNATGLLEYGNQEDLEPRQSSARLSFTPKYLTLEEDSSIHNVLEYGIQKDLEPRQSSSRLSFTPKYLTLEEDRSIHNVLEYGNQKELETRQTSSRLSFTPKYLTLEKDSGIHNVLEYGNQEDLEPRQSSSRLSFTPKYLTLEKDSGIHNVLEYGNREDLEPRQSSSRLSFTSKYLTLEEDSGINNVLEYDSPACFQDNTCCITNLFSERAQHAVALIVSADLDIDMTCKSLPLPSTPFAHDLADYCSSQSAQRGELSTLYLTEGEFDTGLHTSNSRKTYVPFSEYAFTPQDFSVTNKLDRELKFSSLIDSSHWDEPYIPKEDEIPAWHHLSF